MLQVTAVSIDRNWMLRNRGDMQLELTSPATTTSFLLPFRVLDTVEGSYLDWPFMSVHFWGEDPVGNWILTVRNRGDSTRAIVRDIKLILYGTAGVPQVIQNIPENCDEVCARGCARAGPEFCDSCCQFRIVDTLMCVDECPPGLAQRRGYCYDATLPEPACPDAAEYTCSHECEECSKGMVSKKKDACYALCLLRNRHKVY